jgi:hypothetical protein
LVDWIICFIFVPNFKNRYIMGNCTADLNTGMFIVDFKKRDEILDSLSGLLEIDGDLVENEDYFRDDTLSLGYVTEAERIIAERTKGRPIRNEKQFRNVMTDVWRAITDQDYYGECSFDVLHLDDGKMVVSWSVGGRDEWD